MNKELLISIITVNYNDAKGLEKTIQSVRSQTYQDFEHIIIDGDSDDGSKAVIEKHKDSFSYWVSEPDTGIYNAMNKGIKVAKGKYLLFLNSGDILYNDESLECFIPFCNNKNNFDLIYGNLNIIGNTQYIKTYPDLLTFSKIASSTLPHPATLIKRKCFVNNLYDENYIIASDWKFFIIGVCKENMSYKHINSTISTFYLNGISSKQVEKANKERKDILDKNFSLFLEEYKELIKSRKTLNQKRFKILKELEKSSIARKIISLNFRMLMMFLKKK